MSTNIYGDDINYDELNPHTYPEEGPETFYDCPICDGEYLKDLITEENGQIMCIDCWAERYGDDE